MGDDFFKFEEYVPTVQYPFFKIGDNMYIFGSVHSNSPKTISNSLLKFMMECDECITECDMSKCDDLNADILIEAIENEKIDRYELLQTNGNKIYKYCDSGNCDMEILKNNTAYSYYTSCDFLYSNDIIEKFGSTKFFKSSEIFKKLSIFYVVPFLYHKAYFMGIDFYYSLLYKKMKKSRSHLDKENYSIFLRTYLKFLDFFSISCTLIFRLLYGKLKNNHVITGINMDNHYFNNVLNGVKNKKFLNQKMCIERNIEWMKKLLSLSEDEILNKKKYLVIVGAGHVEDLIDRFKLAGKKISQYSYLVKRFI